jgi:hypothetical protein
MRIDELEASRSEFVTTVKRERRRLKIQLSSGLREPLVGLAALLAEASAELAHGDEGAARRLLMAARARLTVAHADLRLLARGVYPAVLSQSGLAVAVRALAEEAEGRLRVVVSPSVEARRRSGVVEAAAYFTLPVMLAAGQRVVRVPTRLMADARRAGRDRGKSTEPFGGARLWCVVRGRSGRRNGRCRAVPRTTSPGSLGPHPSLCGQVPARARCGSTVAGTG